MKALVLGEHTAISLLQRADKYRKIPYLKENEGSVAPRILCVGDRRRVWNTLELLEDSVLIDQKARGLYGDSYAGRVAVGIGLRTYRGKRVPITVLETQMGSSAQDINAWEILAHAKQEYRAGRKTIDHQKIVVLRAGTCGGIIETPKQMQIGDIAVASGSFGDGATLRQRLGILSPYAPNTENEFRKKWGDLGNDFTEDGVFPFAKSSQELIESITEVAGRKKTLKGANFTKESLYAEADEEMTRDLRRKYGAITTEMEHLGLATIAQMYERDAKIRVLNGLISVVVGTIPGGSFAEKGSKEEKMLGKRTAEMLNIALDALCIA